MAPTGSFASLASLTLLALTLVVLLPSLPEVNADLALLEDSSERPKDGAGKFLSDTSGGVSVGAMVGLVGLAITGSLLLAMRLLHAG